MIKNIFIFLALFLSIFLSTSLPVYAVSSVTTHIGQKDPRPIPADFIGFSMDKKSACTIVDAISDSPSLKQMYLNLSPGTFNVAANWGVGWDESKTECSFGFISKEYIKSFIKLSESINYKFHWGLNLWQNNLPAILNETKYMYVNGKNSLISLQISQEPEYIFNDQVGGYSKFKTLWLQAYKTIKNSMPNIPIGGPETTNINLLAKFLSEEHLKLESASVDDFSIGTYIKDDPNEVTNKINLLLSPIKIGESTFFAKSYNKAKEYSLPIHFSGVNNISGGGTPGASDSFASALWATDYLFTALKYGIPNVNLHGNAPFRDNLEKQPFYSPIAYEINNNQKLIPYPRPEYYAMLLFKYAASNGNVVPVTLRTDENISAHSILNNDGKLRLILINKDKTKTVQISINTIKSFNKASLVRLIAPSYDTVTTSNADNKVTFAGSAVLADGTWTPQTPKPITVTNSQSTISLPPASATVVTYQNVGNISGDANGDNKVDLLDFSIWKSEYLNSGVTKKSDFNKDNKVDLTDFSIWKTAYLPK